MNHQEAAKNRVVVLWVAGQIAERIGLFGARKLGTQESRRLLTATPAEEQLTLASYMGGSAYIKRGTDIDPELLKNAAKAAVELEWKWRRTADIVQFRRDSYMWRVITNGLAHIERQLALAKKHKLTRPMEELEKFKKMIVEDGLTVYDTRSYVAINPQRAADFGIDATQFRHRTRCEEELLEQLRIYGNY